MSKEIIHRKYEQYALHLELIKSDEHLREDDECMADEHESDDDKDNPEYKYPR